MFGEGALSHYIAGAELFFAHRDRGMLVSFPEDFAPMKGVCVDGAAIVEYYCLYHSVCSFLKMCVLFVEDVCALF